MPQKNLHNLPKFTKILRKIYQQIIWRQIEEYKINKCWRKFHYYFEFQNVLKTGKKF